MRVELLKREIMAFLKFTIISFLENFLEIMLLQEIVKFAYDKLNAIYNEGVLLFRIKVQRI